METERELVKLAGLEPFSWDKAIDLTEARMLIRGRGKAPAALEVTRRYCKKGCTTAGPAGPVLILPSIKQGGMLWTMKSWVEAFEAARRELGSRGGVILPPPGPKPRTKRGREAGHKRAEARLDKMGVGAAQAG